MLLLKVIAVGAVVLLLLKVIVVGAVVESDCFLFMLLVLLMLLLLKVIVFYVVVIVYVAVGESNCFLLMLLLLLLLTVVVVGAFVVGIIDNAVVESDCFCCYCFRKLKSYLGQWLKRERPSMTQNTVILINTNVADVLLGNQYWSGSYLTNFSQMYFKRGIVKRNTSYIFN